MENNDKKINLNNFKTVNNSIEIESKPILSNGNPRWAFSYELTYGFSIFTGVLNEYSFSPLFYDNFVYQYPNGHPNAGGVANVWIRLTGSYNGDFAQCNNIAGFQNTPANYTCHHVYMGVD